MRLIRWDGFMDIIRIDIKIIPHELQRYDTVTDVFLQDEWEGAGEDRTKVGRSLQMRVSDMGSFGYHVMLIVHALVEYALLQMKNVSLEKVERFEMDYEADRMLGLHKKYEDASMDKNAPNFKEHQFGLLMEKLICKKMKLRWKEYVCALLTYSEAWDMTRQMDLESLRAERERKRKEEEEGE